MAGTADMTVEDAASTALLSTMRVRPTVTAGGSLLALALAGSALVLGLGFAAPAAANAPTVRAAVETVLTSFALAAACLYGVQFQRRRRAGDLALFGCLLAFGFVELFLFAAPTILDVVTTAHIAAAGVFGKLVVAIAFALAAAAPSGRPLGGGRRPIAVAAMVAAIAVVGAELAALLLRGRLVDVSDGSVFGLAHAAHHPLAAAIVLISAGLLAFAATEFAGAARRERNEVFQLLAVACVLQAAGGLYYFALPWLPADWVAPHELLLLLAVIFMLAAALRCELRARARIARAAAIAERRRVAQDLHDGLAQDLALIAAHSTQIGLRLGAEHPVTVAARRALEVSRGTIGELSDPASATVHDALEAVAHELRQRFGITIAVLGSLDVEPAPRVREQFARIAREAIANAARHGGARHVFVSVRDSGDGAVLRVTDDGSGIPVDVHEGFGLGSMRDRAAALGGRLSVRPVARGGTELEVVLP